jgi:hypothetical protein
MQVSSWFPNRIWDGLTSNTWRSSRNDSIDPQQDDWDRIVAEVIATQEFVFGLTSGSDLYRAVAAETIPMGRLVRVADDGRLNLASPDFPAVAGMAVESITNGLTGSYIRRGRAASADWTDVIGASTLSPGRDYFLIDDGKLSLNAPESGFVIRAGQAQSLTNYDFETSQPVRL